MILSDEHRMLKDTIRKFVEKECPPAKAREIDEKDYYPRDILPKLAELGVTGLTISEEYGGMGRDVLGAIIVVEELARRSLSLAWVYVEAVFFGGENISRFGNEEQKRMILPGIAKGEVIFAYALTEPNAGSDTAAVQVTAKRDGDSYLVNGTKIFISGPNHADYILTLTRTNKDVPKHKGLSFFIIDAKSDGISARPLQKMGVHGSDTCEVVFEDVRVPASRVLGGESCLDQGWKQLLGTLDTEHAQVAAGAVGTAQGALEEALKYARERRQFDQPIGQFQSIGHLLAEMHTEITASRLLTYHVAELAQAGKPCWVEGGMAKYYSTETAKKVALNALQIHGGYGYTMEYEIQRYVRDALMLPIGGGTTQIQKNIIAKGLNL